MFWGLELNSCKVVSLTPEYPLHVTKCTLADAGSSNSEQKNVVQCQVGSSGKGQTFIITSLVAGAKEQASLDLVFEPGKKVAFFNSGPGTAHLTGFYVSQVGDEAEADESDPEDEKEEEELMELLFKEDPRRRRGTATNLERFNNENEKEKKAKSDGQKTQKRRVSFVDDSQQPPAKVTKSETSVSKKEKVETKEKKAAKSENVEAKKTKVAAKSESKETKTTPKATSKAAPATRKIGNTGLVVQDIVVGTGPSPVRGRKIVVGYVGRLTNGKVFDKSDKRYPFTFKFGAGEVIKGWDLGIAGMKVGGKRKLTIPPELGYGREGSWPIPPNATLIFDVELIAVK